MVLFVGLLLAFSFVFFSPPPASAQYACVCNGDGSCTGADCTSITRGFCGVGCAPDSREVENSCGLETCGTTCNYSASCVAPGDCSCSGNGNCSDPQPGVGADCSVGQSGNCGDSPCGSSYRPIEQNCGVTSCGYKCIYDQTCATGFCSGGTCEDVQGNFQCGGGGCNVCSRYLKQTWCNGSLCQSFCSNDETCGVGCGGGGPGGPTNTPAGGGGGGPTNTPAGGPATGIIRTRAVAVDQADTSCTAIKAVPITAGQIDGTVHQFTPSSASQPAAQTQVGANFETFGNVIIGSYTLDSLPPTANWAFARSCWTNVTLGTTGEGLSATLGANEGLQWDVGYTLGTAWVQTAGGDVYASGTLRSYLPAVTPRVFNADGDSGYPGVVTYGTSYDFDSDPLSTGPTLVSSANWAVNQARTTTDYYDYFYRRYGAPTTPSDFPNLLAVTKPASSETPYYVVGDMQTSGNWTVGNGESIVFLINGNLTINGRINITGSGFVAFIVNGNISVSSSVGTTAAATTSVVEGIYITNPTGIFATGASTTVAQAKFVGEGMFIAGNFLLERDLEIASANTAYPAELFAYNPQLLLTMPDTMKEMPVTWQEVSP